MAAPVARAPARKPVTVEGWVVDVASPASGGRAC